MNNTLDKQARIRSCDKGHESAAYQTLESGKSNIKTRSYSTGQSQSGRQGEEDYGEGKGAGRPESGTRNEQKQRETARGVAMTVSLVGVEPRRLQGGGKEIRIDSTLCLWSQWPILKGTEDVSRRT